jgi:hypothetical protein
MNNPNPEIFEKNIETIRELSRFLSYRNRKYVRSIESQLKNKPVENFSKSQYNIINGIARRLRREVKHTGQLPGS